MIGQRPKDLVFTLFGEYLLGVDSVWVGSLIALLRPLGLSDGGVRTVLSRMSKKGWLEAGRVGRHAFYSLTPMGRALLQEGQARIYRPEWSTAWDGSWLLLAYSIPQDARSSRDRLRDRLAWLGFGSIGNGLWITPHDVTADVAHLADRMGVHDKLIAFRARRVLGADDAELVQRCWDLERLHLDYVEFVERWRPELEAPLQAGEDDLSGATAYVRRFHLIHEFRRFTLDDPFLPRRLLPRAWGGDEASRLFSELRDRFSAPADAYVAQVLHDAPPRRSAS
ncbi:MAG: PaaX family transcriptional regulator C-terminal domain-containing protein [Gemmatimonadota bacterium]